MQVTTLLTLNLLQFLKNRRCNVDSSTHDV